MTSQVWEPRFPIMAILLVFIMHTMLFRYVNVRTKVIPQYGDPCCSIIQVVGTISSIIIVTQGLQGIKLCTADNVPPPTFCLTPAPVVN